MGGQGPSNPLCRNTRQHSDDGEEEEHGDTGAVGNDGDRAQSRGKPRETAAAQGGHGKARGNRVRRKGPEPEPDPAGCRPFPRRKHSNLFGRGATCSADQRPSRRTGSPGLLQIS